MKNYRICLLLDIIKKHGDKLKKFRRDQTFYICDDCKKIFTNRSSMLKHRQIKHKIAKSTCELCDYTCKDKKNLLVHMNRVHKRKSNSEKHNLQTTPQPETKE